MKLLLYGLNYTPEVTGIGKYSGQLGAWLQSRGNDIKVVSAPPYYPAWNVSDKYRNWYAREKIDGVDVYRCPLYVPSKPTTITRLIHLLSFTLSSVVSLMLLIRWRPKVVINVVPTFFTSFSAWVFCCLTGAKFVIHVQDFESDALFGLRTGKRRGVVEKIWLKIEAFIFSKADLVSTISYAMIDNAISKGVDPSKVFYFPNWSEVELFKDVKNITDFKKQILGTRKEKVVLYSGNMGRKQGLELVIDCACKSQELNDDFLYLFCGDGAAKDDLIRLKDRYNLNNVIFIGLQPYSELPKLLAMADVHLVIQKPDVANAVLPSKLTNILAVGGNAVITTHKETEIGRLIDNNPGIAIAVVPESDTALLNGIKLAAKQKKINNVAMAYAQTHLAKDAILRQFEKKLVTTITKQ